MSTEKLLEVKNLKKTYGLNDNITEALKDISFDVYKTEFLGIMGASGSGKTTLLNSIATMIKPTAGEILLEGRDITKFKGDNLAEYRGDKIGYLFQQFELLDNLTAKENILLPLFIHNVSNDIREDRVKKLGKHFMIEKLMNKFPSQLSGGEKQRVAAARAFISSPSILLADEPTGALDTKSAGVLMDKIEKINEYGSTILMVTHDPKMASYCSRILFIQDGSIFHELRRDKENESKSVFYDRILSVISHLEGGSENVI